MTPAPEIGLWHLLLGVVFVLMAGGASLAWRLGLGRELLVGTLRTFGQLALMGYVLALVFKVHNPLLTLTLYLLMLVAAVRIVRGRVLASRPESRRVAFQLPAMGAMLAGYTLVAWLVCGFIVGSDPWWSPRIFLPIAGMVIGNSMTALAIGLERLFAELTDKRELVEMRLAHGATATEASSEAVAAAIRAGMLPSITSLMGVGLVFIPGMMTGQILAGADPLDAVRYQIVVMLMLVGSTALSSLLVTLIVRRRCFGPGERLTI